LLKKEFQDERKWLKSQAEVGGAILCR